MSATISTNFATERSFARDLAKKQGKPFCQICFDVGMSEREYTNHYVRESPAANSRIACPYLKACVCMNCGNKGHTVKYCRVSSVPAKPVRKLPQQQQQNKPIIQKPKNIFNMLDMEDDDFSDESMSEMSVSVATDSTASIEPSNSYAAVLRRMPAPVVDTTAPVKYDFSVFKTTKRYACWADADDDSDDD